MLFGLKFLLKKEKKRILRESTLNIWKILSRFIAYKSERGDILQIDKGRLIDDAAYLIKSNKNENTLVILSVIANFTSQDLAKEPIVAEIKVFEDNLLFY